MNKPDISSTLPGSPLPGSHATPKAVVHQPAVTAAAGNQGVIVPTRPAASPGTGSSVYVDPYLFQTGYYASQAEYQELSRTAASRIQLRKDVENAKPKRRA